MRQAISDQYSEIAEAIEGEICVHCGGGADRENTILIFAANNRPTVSVHRRCYIHWSFQLAQQGEAEDYSI
jgi:hypothetical protein